MRNHLKYEFDSPLSLLPFLTESFSKELINFPPIHLPPSLRQALFVSAPNQASLPESTPNPSLTYFSEDYTTPSVASSYSSNGAGNGNGNSTHPTKRRIPMERR